MHELPKSLKKSLPISTAVAHQELKTRLLNRWTHCWKLSPRYPKMHEIDKSTPSKKCLKLVSNFSHAQASLTLQLRTGHIGLNKHLHHINCTPNLLCNNCNEQVDETIHHFLFECQHYHQERHKLQKCEQRHTLDPSHLLTDTHATIPLLNYIHSTQ